MNTLPNKRPPFVGHLPFHRRDQGLYFGRDTEIREAHLLIQSHPLLLLSGQAGVGKTSFLNAGLIPVLEDEGIEIFPPVLVGKKAEYFSFKDISNVYISNVLNQWADGEKENQTELTQKTLKGFLAWWKPETANNQSLKLIIFENLEALFTRDPEQQNDRQDFFHQVREALESDSLLRIVFVIRKACIDQLAPFADLLPGRLKVHLELEALEANTALAAITHPLENRHITFEKGVAETLVKDLVMIKTVSEEEVVEDKGQSISGRLIEPTLLQVVCERLWHDMPHDAAVITQNHRTAFADVDRALSTFYERSLQEVAEKTGVMEETLRSWFEWRLITDSGTRGRVDGEETKNGGITDTALGALEDFQLIRSENRDGSRWTELSYERLIRPVIESNHHWRSRKDEGERTRRDLENQAIEWVRLEKKESLLLVGKSLFSAERWMEQTDVGSYGHSEVLRAFVMAGLEKQNETHLEEVSKNEVLRDAEVQKKNAEVAFDQAEKTTQLVQSLKRRSRMMAFVFVLVALAVILVGQKWQSAEKAKVTAKLEYERAREQAFSAIERAKEAETALKASEVKRLETERAKSQAEAARKKAIQDRQRAEAMAALAAVRTREALDSKKEALASKEKALASKEKAEAAETAAIAVQKKLVEQSREARSFLSHSLTLDALKHVQTNPTLSLLLAMEALSISDFAKEAESAEAEDVLFQSIHTLPLISVISVHSSTVNAVVFGRGGRRLASAGADGTAKIWNSFSGNELRIFAHDSPVTSAAYRANGKQLATAGLDGQVKVWQISSGKQLFTVSHDRGAVKSVAFSPDQRYLASAGEKGIALLWDVKSEKLRHRLRGHESTINQIIFSSDGKKLATAGEDGTVRIWDVKSGKVLLKLFWHEQAVMGVAFSPDNKLVVSASEDGNVRVWDIRSFKQGEVQLILSGHTREVLAVAFSPDGRRIATASHDGTVRLWNTNSGEELAVLTGHKNSVTSLAFSPDGRRLVTAGQDKTLRLYSLQIKDMLALARKEVKRSLTPEECKKYLHTKKCQKGT